MKVENPATEQSQKRKTLLAHEHPAKVDVKVYAGNNFTSTATARLNDATPLNI